MDINNNQKGFTLVELLLSLIVVGLISVILTQLLSFNSTSARAFSLYNKQQFTVQDAFNRLSKDIQAASRVVVSDSKGGDKYGIIQLTISEGATVRSCEYKLENSTLSYGVSGVFTPVVDGLKPLDSVFLKGNVCITVVLAAEKSTGKSPMNLAQSFVGEFSLAYKDTN